MTHRFARTARIRRGLVVALAGVWLIAACADKQLEPAGQAITDVEAAVTAAGTEPAKYVPNRVADVQEQIDVLKTRFEQQDYAGVLADAPAALAAAEALPAQAAERRAELHAMLQREWDTLATAVPAEIANVRRDIELLSTRRKLPDGVTAAMLESVRDGVSDADALWERAVAAQAAGNPEESVTLANQARDRLRNLETALGEPSPSPVK